jgi:hypothetical protein
MNDLATTGHAFNPPALQQYGIESAATAVASQAKAMVEARYTIALHRPRNWDQVRQDLLRECRRPAFAHNKSAYYRKPIGAGVEGLGIRFVEVALRCMTNVLIETTMIFEDAQKEVHRVSVTDLEANVTYPLDVKVSKTVERNKPADDGSYISVRKNSYGKDVYTIPANDDDLLNKRAALISKAIRTLGLRIVPGDLCDEAEEIIKKIRTDKAASDPESERKGIVDAFGSIGVKASQLTEYLRHDIDACSPSELVDLRGLFGAIKDGEATWSTVMENRAENAGGGNGGGAPKAPTFYPAERFAKNLPGWLQLVADKKKTVAEVIAWAETKFPLSPEQKKAITDGAAAAPAGAPAATFDQVVAAIKAAQDEDALNVAAGLIPAVTDEAQRAELNDAYDQRLAEIKE